MKLRRILRTLSLSIVAGGAAYLWSPAPLSARYCECSDAQLYEIVGVMMDYEICDATVCCNESGWYMEINGFC